MKGKKTGGRQPGSLNKTTKNTRQVIDALLQCYYSDDKDGVSLMYADFLNLEPKDRITIAEKLMQYTTPKMQSVAVDASQVKKITIEERLVELAKIPGRSDE